MVCSTQTSNEDKRNVLGAIQIYTGPDSPTVAPLALISRPRRLRYRDHDGESPDLHSLVFAHGSHAFPSREVL